MPKWKTRNKIEAVVVVLVLSVLFSAMLPLFLSAQKAANKHKVETTLEHLARLFADMPLTTTYLSRYSMNFRTQPATRFLQHPSVTTSTTTTIEVNFTWRRYWLVLDRIVEHHPEVSAPDIDEEVNYFIDVYDESLFVVYAWMGSGYGEVTTVYLNNEPVFRPAVTISEYYEAKLIAPRYGDESGWDKPGVVYRDSFWAGWRKRPAFFEGEQQPQ